MPGVRIACRSPERVCGMPALRMGVMRMTLPKHDDPLWLHEQKVINRRTTIEIAAECGVTPDLLYRRIRKFKIPAQIIRTEFTLVCSDCQTEYKSKGRKRGADGKFRCRRCQGLISNKKPNSIACQMRHRKSPQKKVAQFAWALKNYYGLTVEQYEQLVVDQHGACAICGNTEPRGRLVVDHDHSTGVVRGLLCHKCNQALGLFKDSRWVLAAGLAYLDRGAALCKP